MSVDYGHALMILLMCVGVKAAGRDEG
jgi:hypothetical protein